MHAHTTRDLGLHFARHQDSLRNQTKSRELILRLTPAPHPPPCAQQSTRSLVSACCFSEYFYAKPCNCLGLTAAVSTKGGKRTRLNLRALSACTAASNRQKRLAGQRLCAEKTDRRWFLKFWQHSVDRREERLVLGSATSWGLDIGTAGSISNMLGLLESVISGTPGRNHLTRSGVNQQGGVRDVLHLLAALGRGTRVGHGGVFLSLTLESLRGDWYTTRFFEIVSKWRHIRMLDKVCIGRI